MNSVNPEDKKETGRFHTEIYNELEMINLRKFQKDSLNKKNCLKGRNFVKAKPSRWLSKAKLLEVVRIHQKNQFALFRKTMRLLLSCGQCLGLNPVIGILEDDPNKLRFKIFSFRFLYSAIILSAQASATILCVIRMVSAVDIPKTEDRTLYFRLFPLCLCVKKIYNSARCVVAFRKDTVQLSHFTSSTWNIGFASFYLSTCLNTFLFMRVSAKWPNLMLKVSKSDLNEYMDPQVGFKCTVATVILLSLALLEHVLSFISRYALVLQCSPDQKEIYQAYGRSHFPWWYDSGFPYHLAIGIGLQLLNVLSTMNWNYSDLFIICMSMYLTSILRKIKQKVMMSTNKNLPPVFWSTLREDYTRATRLVHNFDDVISSVTFFSFASNLFFVCLQLFNVLSRDITSSEHQFRDSCPNYKVGPFNGNEHIIYFFFSLAFILGRSVVVSLIAAGVHTESLGIGPPLYDVPSTVYCEDVQRFIEQVHSDNVALTGLQFFYVTRELVLSVAATVVTYELVLLQFSGDMSANSM